MKVKKQDGNWITRGHQGEKASQGPEWRGRGFHRLYLRSYYYHSIRGRESIAYKYTRYDGKYFYTAFALLLSLIPLACIIIRFLYSSIHSLGNSKADTMCTGNSRLHVYRQQEEASHRVQYAMQTMASLVCWSFILCILCSFILTALILALLISAHLLPHGTPHF